MVGDALRRRRIEDLHHLALAFGPAQQIGRAGQVVRPEHHVDPADLLLDQVTVLLSQAAADGDLQPRLGVHQCLEAPERPVELLVGVLPDAARVEHHHVGLVHVGGLLHAIGHEQAGQPLGVVLVHLAPEGADEEVLGHAWSLRPPLRSISPPEAHDGARAPSLSRCTSRRVTVRKATRPMMAAASTRAIRPLPHPRPLSLVDLPTRSAKDAPSGRVTT